MSETETEILIVGAGNAVRPRRLGEAFDGQGVALFGEHRRLDQRMGLIPRSADNDP